jgi:hypothetical protein
MLLRYLKDVIAHKLPINHEITQILQVPIHTPPPRSYHSLSTPAMFTALQDVFNLLPNLDVDAIIKAFTLQVCIHSSILLGVLC